VFEECKLKCIEILFHMWIRPNKNNLGFAICIKYSMVHLPYYSYKRLTGWGVIKCFFPSCGNRCKKTNTSFEMVNFWMTSPYWFWIFDSEFWSPTVNKLYLHLSRWILGAIIFAFWWQPLRGGWVPYKGVPMLWLVGLIIIVLNSKLQQCNTRNFVTPAEPIIPASKETHVAR